MENLMNTFMKTGFLRTTFLAALVAGSFSIAAAQTTPNSASPSSAATAPSQSAPAPTAATKPGLAGRAVRYQPDRFAGRASTYYSLIWGVDSLSVKWTEQGEIVRFAYRILDPAKAKTLNDKALEPSLIDPQAGVKLVVPALEQVGFLRQSGTPEAGKVYWMAFSNKGRKVKRGDRVTIQIGQFRAVNLVVD
jgi:hypothetical protein